MTWSILSYVAIVVVLGIYSILFIRLDGWRRFAGPAVFFAIVLGSLSGLAQSLGYPKPLWAAPGIGDIQVAGIIYDEPNAIYVWGFAGGSEPIAIMIPWSDNKAKQAYEAQRMAKVQGAGMAMGLKEGVLEFWPAPMPALPPKAQ